MQHCFEHAAYHSNTNDDFVNEMGTMTDKTHRGSIIQVIYLCVTPCRPDNSSHNTRKVFVSKLVTCKSIDKL